MDEDFIKFIRDWCKEQKIINRCKTNFWKCFEAYKEASLKEFSEVFRNENRSCVSIVLDKICLCLNYYCDYGKPTIQIDFYILLKEKQIGWYREIYFTNGEFIDEFFVIE